MKLVMTKSDIASGMRGYVYEKFVGLLFANGKEFKAEVICGDKIIDVNGCDGPKEYITMECDTDNMTRVEEGIKMIIPKRLNQSSFDYILIQKQNVMCLQVTVSNKHEIKKESIERVGKWMNDCEWMKGYELMVEFVVLKGTQFKMGESKCGVMEIDLKDSKVRKSLMDSEGKLQRINQVEDDMKEEKEEEK